MKRKQKAAAFQVKKKKKVVAWNSCRSTSSRIMFWSEYFRDDLLRCFRATDDRKQKILKKKKKKNLFVFSVLCLCCC